MTGAYFAGSKVRRCLARCVKMACSGMNLGVSWQSGTETSTARAPLPSVQNGRHVLGFRITSCATMSHTILCREQENPYLAKTYETITITYYLLLCSMYVYIYMTAINKSAEGVTGTKKIRWRKIDYSCAPWFAAVIWQGTECVQDPHRQACL